MSLNAVDRVLHRHRHGLALAFATIALAGAVAAAHGATSGHMGDGAVAGGFGDCVSSHRPRPGPPQLQTPPRQLPPMTRACAASESSGCAATPKATVATVVTSSAALIGAHRRSRGCSPSPASSTATATTRR